MGRVRTRRTPKIQTSREKTARIDAVGQDELIIRCVRAGETWSGDQRAHLLGVEHVSEEVVGGKHQARHHGRLHEEHGLVDRPQEGGLEENAHLFRTHPARTKT